NVLGVGAPMRHLDERISLAEAIGDRAQRLVHDHGRVEGNLAFLARALDQLLLAVRAAVIEDVLRGRRLGAEHGREHQRDHRFAHASPPLVSINASAIRTPRPRVQTSTGLRSIAAYWPSVAAT